jgi:hypothetical protein
MRAAGCSDEPRPCPRSVEGRRPLMVELLGIAVAVACFVAAFALVYVLDRA